MLSTGEVLGNEYYTCNIGRCVYNVHIQHHFEGQLGGIKELTTHT